MPSGLRIKIEISQPFVLPFGLIVTSRLIYDSHLSLRTARVRFLYGATRFES